MIISSQKMTQWIATQIIFLKSKVSFKIELKWKITKKVVVSVCKLLISYKKVWFVYKNYLFAKKW